MLQYVRSYEAVECGLPTLLRSIVQLRCYFTLWHEMLFSCVLTLVWWIWFIQTLRVVQSKSHDSSPKSHFWLLWLCQLIFDVCFSSEIILIIRFSAQETFLIITVENSCTNYVYVHGVIRFKDYLMRSKIYLKYKYKFYRHFLINLMHDWCIEVLISFKKHWKLSVT